jgi:hypothetical protein
MNQLRNETAVALEVSIWVPDSGEPETVSLLPPGEMLPLPLRRGGESYALRLRPASGVHGWCKPTRVPDATPEPGGDGTVMVAASLPLECPAVAAEATPWHCLLHHDTYHEGHMCELTLHPPIELRNLLAGTMRFELIGSGRAEGRSLPSGDSMCTHAFARMTAISFSMQLRGYLPSEKVVALLTGSQGEPRAALSRIAMDEHPEIALSPGDRVIFSSRTIPGNEKAVGAIHNALANQNIEIITDRQALVHVSGHPRREELKQMYGWVRPRIAIPAHGEPLHLHEHARLATALKVPHVLVVTNGDMIALDPSGPVKIDDVPSGRIFQDGELRIGAGEKTVPDRRKLSFAGIVSVAIAIDDKGNIAGDLEIACMGLPPKTVDGDTFDDVVNDAVLDLVENMPKQRRRDPEGLRNSIEKAVRGAVGEEWGKKPVVHALVIEV